MKTIVLRGEKELQIYSFPLRQRILKEMQKAGRPVTAKQIADRLEIAPSSAQHHMKKLASIGLVEADHVESINGIQAKFMRLTNVTVSIGQQIRDELSPSRDVFMKHYLDEAFDGYSKAVSYVREHPQLMEEGVQGDVLTEIVHLTDKQAQELYDLVRGYISKHVTASDDTHPWELAILAYKMDLPEPVVGNTASQ